MELAAEAVIEADGEGSLQQERHPGLPGETSTKPARRPADPLGLDEDEDDLNGSAPLLARMNPLAPVVAADGINQSSDRGSELIPSFGA